MYAEHNPIIAQAMKADPAIFFRGCLLAILSARQKFIDMRLMMADVDKNGENSERLFGWKKDSFRWLEKNHLKLHADILAEPHISGKMAIVTQCPGLGIVKGAFVLQLMGYNIACLDSRNVIREEKYDLRQWEAKKGTPRWDRKVSQYIYETNGRSEYLWDAWCEDVADAYGRSAEKISFMHIDMIVPQHMRFLLQTDLSSATQIGMDCPF